MSNKTEAAIANLPCLICGEQTHILLDPELDLSYDVCDTCHFIYKKHEHHVDATKEKERYLQHHNDEQNIGYKTYLELFIKNHIRPLEGVQMILDFGSGPYPLLAKLLQNEGYSVMDYDPFFHDDISYTKQTYDLIILTEVLEHVFDPMNVLQQLIPLLNKYGKLIIMTQFRDMDSDQFLKWWYRRDITHVSFFNDTTFDYIKDYLKLDIIENNHKDVILFQKAW